MKLHFLYIALFISTIAVSQKKEKDTLNTEVINVVKTFNPSVSDAFKITRNPKLEQDSIVKHKPFNYKIFSVPVASTFKPKQGTFVGLKHFRLKSIYNNFVSVGFGNNNTPFVEAFAHSNTTKDNDFGAFLNIISSDGGVSSSVLDDAYSDVKLDAYYKQYNDNFDWQVNSGVRFQKYNWYGISPIISPLSPDLIASINPEQTFANFYVGGKIDYFNSAFQGGTFEYNYLSDDYKTSENYVYTASKFAFPLSSEYLITTVSLGYLDGKFNRGFNDVSPISYQFFNVGFHPNLEVLRKNLTFNLGVKLYYSSATAGQEESKFFAYPNITASYKISSGTLTAFAGITGDLQQNTYNDFVNENSFVSPTLNIKRTNQQYNAYLGIKGVQNNISYQLKASYQTEKDKALFVLNPVKELHITNRAYEFGNSFDVVYDAVNTFSFTAKAEVYFSNQLKFGGGLTVNSYSLSSQQEAWNLPELKASVYAKYSYKKWFAKTTIFIVGERKGLPTNLFPTLVPATFVAVANDAYVDLNINGGYTFSDRLTAFAKFNNILGDDYQTFTNFSVQGFQALAGITYKFDFK